MDKGPSLRARIFLRAGATAGQLHFKWAASFARALRGADGADSTAKHVAVIDQNTFGGKFLKCQDIGHVSLLDLLNL
jgi:hypothetical protein